jgi:streptomycin 6-kinase
MSRLLAHRLEQLTAELGIDRHALIAWSVVRAVLSGFWSLEDEGRGWEEALTCADLLAGLEG